MHVPNKEEIMKPRIKEFEKRSDNNEAFNLDNGYRLWLKLRSNLDEEFSDDE